MSDTLLKNFVSYSELPPQILPAQDTDTFNRADYYDFQETLKMLGVREHNLWDWCRTQRAKKTVTPIFPADIKRDNRIYYEKARVQAVLKFAGGKPINANLIRRFNEVTGADTFQINLDFGGENFMDNDLNNEDTQTVAANTTQEVEEVANIPIEEDSAGSSNKDAQGSSDTTPLVDNGNDEGDNEIVSTPNNDSPATLKNLEMEIKFFLKQTAQNIFEVGKRLIQAKIIVGHGGWADWLDKNFGLTQQSANNFMRIAERFSKLKIDFQFKPTQWIAMLTLPEGDEEKFIADKAAVGTPVEDMTIKNLREEIKQFKKSQSDSVNEISRLQNIVEETRAAVDKLTADKTLLEKQLAEKPVEIEKEVVPADYDSTKAELEAKTSELEIKTAEIATLQAKIDELQKAAPKIHTAELLKRAKKERDKKAQKVMDYETKLVDAKQELQDVEDQISRLERQLAAENQRDSDNA